MNIFNLLYLNAQGVITFSLVHERTSKALNIRVGKVSGNTDIFVFGLIMTFHEIFYFLFTQILIFISYLKYTFKILDVLSCTNEKVMTPCALR
jgi:hypothetical protein